jgi:hypothetical protein
MENNVITKKKQYSKFPFGPDDFIVDILFNDKYFRYEVFILREYKIKDIDNLVLYILPIIQNKRHEMEEKNMSFQEKKLYLQENNNNSKIQITLDGEEEIKTCIEKYKIYEFINWFHLYRNDKIVEYCSERKKEILDHIYPIVYLPICKVIGSKVISPANYDIFEDVINMAWVNIIKYIPKMDTSKVMFSIFVATAQNSAKNFRTNYREDNYKFIKMTDLESILNIGDEEDISESFVDGYLHMNNIFGTNDENLDIDELIDSIGYDDIIDEMGHNNITNNIKKLVEQYSYSVLAYTKQKNINNIFKIFAKFFIDLINNNIPLHIIQKHSNSILNIFDTNNQILSKFDTGKMKENNKSVYKLFKDFIKYKMQNKLNSTGTDKSNNLSVVKMKQYHKVVDNELLMMNILQENQHKIFNELLKYKNYAISNNPVYN